MELKGRKVTVVGLGNSGTNAALLLDSIGSVVRATDSHNTRTVKDNAARLTAKSIKCEIDTHTEDFIKGSDLVVISPGIDNNSPPVKWAEEHRIPIIGEMELGFRFCKGKIIAITGTNGKSTVTTLIGEILKDGGKDVCVCGNIGNSLCGEIAHIKEETFVVLEVSSFQLERTQLFKPYISIILNITDDHMDRYSQFSDYFNEKLKVFKNQDRNDILILNYDAENLRPLKDMARSKVLFYSKSPVRDKNIDISSYIHDGRIRCVVDDRDSGICGLNDIALKGVHNIENALACCLAGLLLGVPGPSIQRTIMNFKGLRHRFETVGTIDGVEYVDDSKGTTVDSTIRALESCGKPVVLIAGGKDKNSNYKAAKDVVKKKVRHLILIGEARAAIRRSFGDAVATHEAKDMADAVLLAHKLSSSGFIVLLSPMCSSFDMFKDYKERGEVFGRAVMSLRSNSGENRI